jgi:methionyl aminopeptidase
LGIYIYNQEQIRYIEKACLIAARVLDEINRVIDVGISTYELDRLARDVIAKSGAKPAFLGYKGYPSAICASINEVVVHGIPQKSRKLKDGDIIGIDVGTFLNGYYGDTARSFRVGRGREDSDLLLRVTRESLYAAIDKCVVGNRISDISHAVEAHVEMHGFSPVREFVGHGIGRNLHEEPSIPNFGSPGKGPRIKEGMVFAIEPMINMGTYMVEVDANDEWTVYTKDRQLSAHFEHTVAIVNGRAKILTRGKNFN